VLPGDHNMSRRLILAEAGLSSTCRSRGVLAGPVQGAVRPGATEHGPKGRAQCRG
jgi:hypothetical protein